MGETQGRRPIHAETTHKQANPRSMAEVQWNAEETHGWLRRFLVIECWITKSGEKMKLLTSFGDIPSFGEKAALVTQGQAALERYLAMMGD